MEITCNAASKINRFRAKIEYAKENSREKIQKHFDALVKFLHKHPEEFQKFRPKNGIKIENIAESKINRFRDKILQQQRLVKHFDALVKFLHKHPEEFQKYQPQRIRNKLQSPEEISVGTTVMPSLDQIQAPQTPLEVENDQSISSPLLVSTISASAESSRNRSRNNFASKHLMRIGTDKLRHTLIHNHLNRQFNTMTVNDFNDEEFQKLFRSIGDDAQFRAKSMFYRGFYDTKKDKNSFPIIFDSIPVILKYFY